MGRIPDETLQRIRDRVDIVDLVGRFVSLRKSGRSFKGLCPFHDEKTPSFSVNPERQAFYCFGCQEKGNALTFLMRMENLTFPEAARALAQECGIEVPETESGERGLSERLHGVNELAQSRYRRALAQAGNAGAAYLFERDHDGATSPRHYESEEYQEFVPLLLANVFCESSMIEPALLLTGTTPSEGETLPGLYPVAVPILDENQKLSVYGLVENTGKTNERTDEPTFLRLAYLLQYLLKEEDLAPTEGEEPTGLSFGLGEETKISEDKAKELTGYLVDWMDTENNTFGLWEDDKSAQ